MKTRNKLVLIILFTSLCCFTQQSTADIIYQGKDYLATPEGSKVFARSISDIIEKAWRKWQDNIVINNVSIDGAQGIIFPGTLSEGLFKASLLTDQLDKDVDSEVFYSSVSVIAKAIETGMQQWQKGYSNHNIFFPQGVSCVYTLTPCHNVPVAVSSGISSQETSMSRDALFNFMLYNSDQDHKPLRGLYKAVASAMADSFYKWRSECVISDILGSGGVAPKPAPIGSGPGPVRGAKGRGGCLVGAYLDGNFIHRKILEYFEVKGYKYEKDYRY